MGALRMRCEHDVVVNVKRARPGRPPLGPAKKIPRPKVSVTPEQDAWIRAECARRGCLWPELVRQLIDAEMDPMLGCVGEWKPSDDR